MVSAIRDLWAWLTQHRTVLWLATVAAFPQLHYLKHGPRPDLLLLPGLALSVFLIVPWAAAIAHDNWGPTISREPSSPLPRWRSAVAIALALVGTGCALAVAFEWGYSDLPRKVLVRRWAEDPSWFVQMVGLGVGSVGLAAGIGAHRVADWGLGLGDWRSWGPLVLIVTVVLGISIPFAAWLDPSFIEFYPRHPAAKQGDVLALAQYQLSIGIFMFCWEFLFRGFMLFGFARALGPLSAILLQAFPFYVLHARKPETELIASWFGGVIAGWFAWRSKSCWPTAILHTVMYATMEITAFGFRFGFPGSS